MRLQNYPIFQTSDPDEANARLTEEFHSRTRVFSPRFSFAISGVALSRLRVTYITSRAARETWTEYASAPYSIIARRRGGMRCRVRGFPEFDFEPGQIRLFSPSGELTCAVSDDAPLENIGISIPADYLRQQAERIAGHPIERPFEPTGAFDARSAVGRRIEWMLNDLEGSDSVFARDAASGRGDPEGDLVAAIIEQTPNNFRELLERPGRVIVSMRHVRLAEEWMMAHLMTPFTIADAAHAAGIGVRALEKAFARYRGCRPGDFRRFMREKYSLWERSSRP